MRTRGRTFAARVMHWAGIASLGVTLLPALASAQESDDAAGPGAIPGGSAGAVIKEEKPEPAPPPPTIVMPKQTKFVDAAYPPEAQAANLQATVVLRLDIDKTGKVVKAEPMEP